MDAAGFSRDAQLAAAEEAVRRADEKATAGHLALEMIHEFKNPLEALGHLTYLALEEAEDPGCVRKYMVLAQEQMALLREIAEQTLGFARSSRVPRTTKGIALANAALRIHQRKIEAKRIHLVTRLAEDVTAEVRPSEVLQVLSNLLGNALDALGTLGTLHFRVRKAHGKVHFVIADNGHGISPEDRGQLFQSFFTTKQDEGTGLGLALSKRIIEGHGGKITVRSSIRPGRTGTVFRISLPA